MWYFYPLIGVCQSWKPIDLWMLRNCHHCWPYYETSMITSFSLVFVGTYCLLRQRCAKQAAVTLPRRELEPDKPTRYYYSIVYAQFLRDEKKQIYILQDHVPQSINQWIEIFYILKQFYVSTYVFSSLDVTWINKMIYPKTVYSKLNPIKKVSRSCFSHEKTNQSAFCKILASP